MTDRVPRVHFWWMLMCNRERHLIRWKKDPPVQLWLESIAVQVGLSLIQSNENLNDNEIMDNIMGERVGVHLAPQGGGSIIRALRKLFQYQPFFRCHQHWQTAWRLHCIWDHASHLACYIRQHEWTCEKQHEWNLAVEIFVNNTVYRQEKTESKDLIKKGRKLKKIKRNTRKVWNKRGKLVKEQDGKRGMKLFEWEWEGKALTYQWKV